MELIKKSGVELSAMLAERKCGSEELVREVFARTDECEAEIGAFITLTKESALEKARAVDKKIAAGEKPGLLEGIPIALKDNFCTKDVLTTCASKMLYNFLPPYSAFVVDKIEEAGLICVGKTNMDEFAMGSTCETSYFKKTRNPLNPEYVPGGSSGGSAAAVKSGQTILALGSDTGGSIRQPAAFCGIVGFKPTYGLVSRFGIAGYGSSLDQAGPMTKTVEDSAALLTLIAGSDKRDSTSVDRGNINYFENLSADVKGLRIGIPKEYYGPGIDAEVADAVMKSVAKLEAAGAIVKQVSVPSIEHSLAAYYIIASAEAASNLAAFDGVKYGYRAEKYSGLSDMYDRTRAEGFGEEVKRRIILGTIMTGVGYYEKFFLRAVSVRAAIQKEFAAVFESCDALITPTAPGTSFKLGEKIEDPVKMYATDLCTVSVNIAELPAISVPCGLGANNMPIGMQIIGPKFSEQTLLNLAYNHEKTHGELFGVAAR